MEFEKLTRRELQAVCKKNKIPANITNVAMTQALKSLSSVEGIEEIIKPSQSETAQSSIESPERKDVTSPRIPPTGGRTTRRRTAMKEKEEPETLQPVTRTTRRSTRKTLAADDTQTSSVVQTTIRKARMNSVCRKMDSQLKECEDEEKKRDTLVTPAPSEVSTRKRGMKEESMVKREYGTRRSVRLAAKKVDVTDLKVDAFTKEGENVNMNIKESMDNVEEDSGITGNDANATAEKNFEQTKELEVVSAQMHYMQIDEVDYNAAIVVTLEGIGELKDVQADRHAPTGKETEQEAAFEETVQKSEINNRKLDGRIITVNIAVDKNLEENSEEEEELEVVSTQKHGIQIGEGENALTVYNLERKDELEDVLSKENSHTADKEIEHGAVFKESEVDSQKLDEMIIDVNTSAEENSEEVFEASAQKHCVRIGKPVTSNYANATVEKNSGQKEEVVVISGLSTQTGEEGNSALTLDNLEAKVELEEIDHTDKEIEQEDACEEETVQTKTDLGSQELDGECIDLNPAVENSEEKLKIVSAQKKYMQVGEEGDNNAVANLDEKSESEHVTAEEHAHTGEENEAAPLEEGTEQKSKVDEQKLDGESIHGKAGEDENLVEIFEGGLEVMSAQNYYMQIGEEGDDHAAVVDTLEGTSEDVQAEGHAHTGIEIEEEATFEIKMGQKSVTDDQYLNGEIIDVNTGVDRSSEGNVETKVDLVEDLKTTIEDEDEGNFETDGLKGEIKDAKNLENDRFCFLFETKVEVDKDNGQNMVHDNDEVEVDSVKGLKSTVEEEGEGDSETDGLKSEEVKNMENAKAGIHSEPVVEVDEDDKRALDVCNYDSETSAQVTEQPDTAKEVDYVEKPSAIIDNSEHETEVDFSFDTETCNEMEKQISEEKDMEFKQLPSLSTNEVQEIEANTAANMHGDLVENELNLDKSPKSMIVEAKVTKSNDDVPLAISFAGSDSDLIVKPACLTPYNVSATNVSPMMQRVTLVSNNKDNIDSGSKINLPTGLNIAAITENVDNDKRMEDLSVRKLGKMLSKKLEITNKFSRNQRRTQKNISTWAKKIVTRINI